MAGDGLPRPIRIAGGGRLDDGAFVTWVVSEGRKGRRWREAIAEPSGGGLRSSLLYETDRDGRFAHLELATVEGLLTLHPEGDGTLHGNVVTADGVRHVVGYPFPRGTCLVVAGSPIAAAAAVFGLAPGVARGSDVAPTQGSPELSRAVAVGPTLELATIDLVVASRPDGRWHVLVDRSYLVDADGLSVLPGEQRWPLELGGEPWTDRGQTSPHAQADRETRG